MVSFRRAEEAVALIADGDTVAINASGTGVCEPSLLIEALADRFTMERSPRDLTLVHATAIGGVGKPTLDLLADPGLVRRKIGGSWNHNPKWAQRVKESSVSAFNLPQGVLTQLFRVIAGGLPGLITSVGTDTFVDPRWDGGRLTSGGNDVLVDTIRVPGNQRDWLFFRAFPINVAMLKASTIDEDGNLSFEREAAVLDALSLAQAARASGGMVLVQAARVAEKGTIPAERVRVPGHLVDIAVIHADAWQTYVHPYDPALSGELRTPLPMVDSANHAWTVRRLIAEIATDLIEDGFVVNVGTGVSAGVAEAARNRSFQDRPVFTIEQGVVGGIPVGTRLADGGIFGVSRNPTAFIDAAAQFDFYGGGALDCAFLSFAEMDGQGNANASWFGDELKGSGGFIDISQGARHLVFCSTFSASGLQVRAHDGGLKIEREGRVRKFVSSLQHRTFSGGWSAERGQRVSVVTERCVFELEPEGLRLSAVAPGISVERQIVDLLPFPIIVPDTISTLDSRLFSHLSGGEAPDAVATP